MNAKDMVMIAAVKDRLQLYANRAKLNDVAIKKRHFRKLVELVERNLDEGLHNFNRCIFWSYSVRFDLVDSKIEVSFPMKDMIFRKESLLDLVPKDQGHVRAAVKIPLEFQSVPNSGTER